MQQLKVTFACLVLVSQSFGAAASDESKEETTLQRWDRVVGLHSPGDDADAGHLATAFVVAAEREFWVVTAGHAARQTSKESRLLYRSADGQPQWVSFKVLFSQNGNPWEAHSSSDLAVAPIVESKQSLPYLSQLKEIAIPLKCLSQQTHPRTTRVEIAGFPLGIGLDDEVSPVAVVGHLVSRETRAKNEWGTEIVQYCSPDIAQGTSGGAAFLAESDLTATTVVGMYIGVVLDKSGGKLSKLVPSRIIREVIENARTQVADPEKDSEG